MSTPALTLAKGLELCGIEPSIAIPLAAKALQEMRKSYVVLPLEMEPFIADTLRRKGFTEGGAETIYKLIALGGR